MGCKGCQKKYQATLPPGVRLVKLKNEPNTDPEPDSAFVEFIGNSTGSVVYKGPSGTSYRFSSGFREAKRIPKCDADFFARLPRLFRVGS